MARDLQEVKKTVRRFSDCVSEQLPVKKVLLYGSYAKGTATDDSDVDVAVFLDCKDHAQRIVLATQLFHCAGEIDVEIEPKCYFWDEYNNCLRGSILAEILKTAVDVA